MICMYLHDISLLCELFASTRKFFRISCECTRFWNFAVWLWIFYDKFESKAFPLNLWCNLGLMKNAFFSLDLSENPYLRPPSKSSSKTGSVRICYTEKRKTATEWVARKVNFKEKKEKKKSVQVATASSFLFCSYCYINFFSSSTTESTPI